MKRFFERVKAFTERIFERVKAFMLESNHWKHLLGGLAVGLGGLGLWTAVYAGLVAGCCLELKDELYGGRFDLTDLTLTAAGALAGGLLWALCGLT